MDTLARLRAAALRLGASADGLERVVAASSGTAIAEAIGLFAERRAVDEAIAACAEPLLPARGAVLSVGNSGALATGAGGTALRAIIRGHQAGKQLAVFLSETRPLSSGLRLAAFECAAAGIASTVFPDGAAAALMAHVPIATIVVGARAMAGNGDCIGEIGTYGAAVAAAHHRIPFYVALTRSAIDVARPTGTGFLAMCAALPATGGAPLEDVTPGRLISAIATEFGIIRPPYTESLPSLATRPHFAFVQRNRPRSDPPDA